MFEIPILFMLFNRPKHTARVLERILAVAPRRLFISADGPRASHPDDVEKCSAVRELVDSIPAGISIEKLYRKENLGCKKSGIEALCWFFESNEYGIILEDDTLPDPSFFSFAERALTTFRAEENLMVVSGHNPIGSFSGNGDAVFSKYPFIWGWGSWRRAWKLYRENVNDWESDSSKHEIKSWLRSNHSVYFWNKAFREAAKGSQVWDYQLCYTMFLRHSLALVSAKNLVANIGFGAEAVHTINPSDSRGNIPVSSAPPVVRFPRRLTPDESFDRAVVKALYVSEEQTLRGRVKNLIRPSIKLMRTALRAGKPERGL